LDLRHLLVDALVSSGLQIFNAAPYLDASDKSDPHHRVDRARAEVLR